MNEEGVIEKIKEVILDECGKAGVEVVKIILFGSRARGDAKPDSDFDVYVVVKEIDFNVYKDVFVNIQRRIVEFNIICDLIIRPLAVFQENKTFPGYVSYYVEKEGKSIWIKN